MTIRCLMRSLAGLVLFGSVSCTTSGSAVDTKRVMAPGYPPLALSAGVEGDVVVLVTIDESGTVRAADVTKGHALLDPAALAASRQWSFNTGRRSRQAQLTFSFRLVKDPATSREARTVFELPLHVEVFAVLPPPVVNYDHPESR
jgi:TonB family protein